jgi:hypothetical protein
MMAHESVTNRMTRRGFLVTAAVPDLASRLRAAASAGPAGRWRNVLFITVLLTHFRKSLPDAEELTKQMQAGWKAVRAGLPGV